MEASCNLSTFHDRIHTAFNNDENPDFAFAQQVVTFPENLMTFFGVSAHPVTQKCCPRIKTANALGLKTIALNWTGWRRTCDFRYCNSPAEECGKGQELHLPIYHAHL